jgi:hypothetical protein
MQGVDHSCALPGKQAVQVGCLVLVCSGENVFKLGLLRSFYERSRVTLMLQFPDHLADLVAGLDVVAAKLLQPVNKILIHVGNSSTELNLQFESFPN